MKYVLKVLLMLVLPLLALCAEPQPEQALDKARDLFSAGKWEEADKVLGEYVKRHPAPPFVAEAIVLQGRCQARRGFRQVSIRK